MGRREKIFIAATIVRKSSGRVMSATPTKVCKRGRKPKIDIQKISSCRFCGVTFTSGGGRASFENIFSPSDREESVGLILAECCGSIGFPLTRDENFSERVCRSCGGKIRNAAELYSFNEQAVCSTRVDKNLNQQNRCFTIQFKVLGANKHLIYEAFAVSCGQHR